MSEFKVNTITNRDGSYGPQVCGITTFGSSGMQLPSGPTEFRGGRGRGVFSGGRNNPVFHDTMNLVEIATTGNAVDFGNLSKKLMVEVEIYQVQLEGLHLEDMMVMQLQLLVTLIIIFLVLVVVHMILEISPKKVMLMVDIVIIEEEYFRWDIHHIAENYHLLRLHQQDLQMNLEVSHHLHLWQMLVV